MKLVQTQIVGEEQISPRMCCARKMNGVRRADGLAAAYFRVDFSGCRSEGYKPYLIALEKTPKRSCFFRLRVSNRADEVLRESDYAGMKRIPSLPHSLLDSRYLRHIFAMIFQ